MLNDRDEKYEGQDDTEYHFSDEEVNYDAEGSDAPPKVAAETKVGAVANIVQSKRMLISLGVFVALVFVVYKMVSPAVTTPDTDIKPVVAVQQTATPPTAPKSAPFNTAALAQPAAPVTPAPVVSAPPAPPAIAPVQMPAPVQPQAVAPEAVAPQQPAYVAPPPAQVQPVAAPNPYGTAAMAPQQPTAQVETMSPPPEQPPASAAPTYAVPGAAASDAKVVTLAVQNERLMSQLQSQYDQRISDYQNQNKNLQEQLQTLNSRVAGMESQMGKMMQTLPTQNQVNTNAEVPVPTEAEVDVVSPKIAYTVQAIIPGRAWLKSDNGDTITVAEGDTIKDLGRVTKIDPYDGIVEINTGKKTVALSYGTGG